MICSTTGCQHEAVIYPIICLPPPLPFSDALAARMFSSVAICKGCGDRTKIEHFLLPEGIRKITAAFAAQGKMRPDFDRAWLEFGKIGDEEWITSQGILPKAH